MPRVAPMQGNFLGGEIGATLHGRTDSDRYKNSLAVCLNYIPTIQGALTRRPGSQYIYDAYDSTQQCRLIKFQFSTTQVYVLEFGAGYIRFFKNGAPIIDPTIMNLDGTYTTPYKVTTTFSTLQVQQMSFTQSADVLYLAHGTMPPMKLSRFSDIDWTLTQITFLDGPYLDSNGTATTFTCSGVVSAAAAGSPPNTVTVTASSTAGINTQAQYFSGGPGFIISDLGRLIRMSTGGADPNTSNGFRWVTLQITAVNSSTQVVCNVLAGPTATVATTWWRLGAWGLTTGWPSTVTFHQDRLFYGGIVVAPQRLDGSNAANYENFSPSDIFGTVSSNNAYTGVFNSNDVNAIHWLVSGKKGLFTGTQAGEWIAAPADGGPLTPKDPGAAPATFYGSAATPPVQIESAVLFVQRSGKKIRELTYVYYLDGYQAPDLTSIAPHMANSGFVMLAYQKEPQPIVWAVRNDGVLTAMTYERELDALKVAWSRHILGGYGNAMGAPPVVEGICVIPNAAGDAEELWMVVKRYINGTIKRCIERLTPFFTEETLERDAFFVDSGFTYDNPKVITSIGAGIVVGPNGQFNVQVTVTAHGFSNGDRVYLSELSGIDPIDGEQFIVGDVTANTFTIKSPDDGTTYIYLGIPAYVGGGHVRKMITHITGLDRMNGEILSVLVDGSPHPDVVVSGGAIDLEYPGAVVHVGYPYNSDAQLLRPDAGAADGTAMGKTRRINRVGFMLHRSLGLQFGVSFDKMDSLNFRTMDEELAKPTPLFSGIISQTLDADYNFENQICWRQDQPLPSTILAVMPQMLTEDRG